jgi:copper transport protein
VIASRRVAPRSRARRAVLALVGIAVLVLGPAQVAGAHAELSSSDPSDGSVLATSPQAVNLQFTEGVSVQADGVRILDGKGERVDAGTATSDGSSVTVPLDGSLSDGSYAVAWRVVSADGHPVRGAFSFSVGVRTQLASDLAGEAFGNNPDTRDEVIGAILRGLTYLGALGAAGAVLVGAALRRPDEGSPVGPASAVVAVVGLVALLLQLPVQASLATGRGWGSLGQEGVLRLVLSDGVGWAIGVTGCALVALLLATGLPFRGAARVLALGGAAIAPVGLVITGHTRTMSPAVVAYASDAAHVVAAGMWSGGLVALLVVVGRRRRNGDGAGAVEAVARFSGWAALALAAVAVTGTTLGWIEVGGLHALTSTSYGKLLMAKVAAVGVVVAGGAWNRFRLLPALVGDGIVPADPDPADPDPADPGAPEPEAGTEGASAAATVAAAAPTGVEPEPGEPGEPDEPTVEPGDADGEAEEAPPARRWTGGSPTADHPAWGALVRVLRIEVLALLVVLGLTAVFTNITPARTAAGSGVVSTSAPFGEGSVDVTIDPASPGRNDIHVYVLDARGRPDDRYDDADLALSLPAQDVGPLHREPVSAGAGHFQLVGTDLPLAGEWTLTITVRPDRFSEQAATVRFRVR